jgi:hypothetical protein
MVRIPTSKKYKWFVRNTPTWLPNVLDAVCPAEVVEVEEEGDNTVEEE